MRGDNLPLAQNIGTDLPDFESLRSFVGNRLNITNIELVLAPDWGYDLFDDLGRFPDDSPEP
jgi:hypothetical protein